MQTTPIVTVEDITIHDLLDGVEIAKVKRGQKYPHDRQTDERYYYLDMITSFDIETSKEKYGSGFTEWRSWMYIWQWQFGERFTVIGRTWDEFINLVDLINSYLPEDVRLLCYVHNLAYEFQFISGVWDFKNEDIFATDVRSPLYCRMGKIELRCSYMLSNYGLAKWAEECKTDHQKLVGNLDYNIVRYPWTEITPDELAYCVNDVICVVECVMEMLRSYGDTVYSIPYTSTGYVRRRVRAAMTMWSPNAVKQMSGDLRTYDRLREAFRGGNTHANRWWVRDLLGDVFSYDRSSSYPDVICHCKFPMSRFKDQHPDFATLQRLLNSGKAVLLRAGFTNIRLKSERIGLPYIPLDKCIETGYYPPVNPELDNGRILRADYLEIAITDIDLEIIQRQYDWDGEIFVGWMMAARYGYLPRPLVDVAISLYKAKTALKGIKGQEAVYNHSKAELNSIYGMMVQRVITNPIVYVNGEWGIGEFDRPKEYAEAIQHAYVAYQWGVWVTAWARYRLQEGVEIADKLYPDCRLSRFRLC